MQTGAREPNPTPDAMWMRRASELAERARAAGNTAVGALIVLDGKMIAEAEEETPAGPRPFAHAELLAVEAVFMEFRDSLRNATLYSTAEPCVLCAFAIREAHIGRVVIGREAGEIGGVRSRFPVLTADWVPRWGAPPEIVWWEEGW
ncbi:MAG TPA: deaminase [Gemmatimonadales bacterium]|nr:deaminase [Gemmatimonadales bacterium]